MSRWGLVLAGALLVGCSTEESPPEPAPSVTSKPAPAPTPTSTPVPTPVPTPTPSGQPSFAEQLDAAEAVLRDPASADADVRSAAEFQQFAVRRIANAAPAFGARVLRRLDPAAARSVRDNVFAARELLSLTDPQPALPKWRIVEPPSSDELLALYRAAEQRTGVPWEYLAAIHLVETRMGRIRGTSTAGAQGPMQFLPSTWESYGAGGDINDPGDAILAAARLLRANGAPGDLSAALWNYNHSDRYVRAVTTYARAMERAETAYRAYWHWRVLYRHRSGTYVLPLGYPDVAAELVTQPTG